MLFMENLVIPTCRPLNLIEELEVEAKLVPNRRGQLYQLAADALKWYRPATYIAARLIVVDSNGVAEVQWVAQR